MIGVGDLVYMARRVCDCEVCREPLGIPFVVTEIVGTDKNPIYCASNWSKAIGTAPLARGFDRYQIPVSALKKIDPLPDDEHSKSKEELEA